MPFGNALDAPNEGQFDRQFAANVKSVLFGGKAAARAFGNGVIVNVS
jgi:NAD(P)-dependent dehydrogenase (short-subunit alcohol dehydrogenase family)